MREEIESPPEPQLFPEAQGPIELTLVVRDPDMAADLVAHREGRARTEFALAALRIGLLALRQARGQVDAEAIRREGERLVAGLQHELQTHREHVQSQLQSTLKEYFDPQSGRFEDRLRRLVQKDGELESVLRRQIGADDSEMAKTLAAHFGAGSPLMKLLSPSESEGLLCALGETVAKALEAQRERILAEFSLDRKESALSRLVADLSERHGKLGETLQGRLDAVVREFSLDQKDSALSRLVEKVTIAQKTISSEFSLDAEGSALARLRRELLEVLRGHAETNQRFQAEVRAALEAMRAQRAEAEKSTRHGLAFEDEVQRFVQTEAQRAGDVAAPVGTTTGLIRGNKKGDCVVELGPDAAAAGAKIVVEAKENAQYDLSAARAEIEEARRNRGAQAGLFVFSRRIAPKGLDRLARYGDDVVVVWDADDPQSDVFLLAGLSLCRALCTRAAAAREKRAVDFTGIDRAINEVQRQAKGLDEIESLTSTIQSHSGKILDRARIMRREVDRQLALLREGIDGLRGPGGG